MSELVNGLCVSVNEQWKSEVHPLVYSLFHELDAPEISGYCVQPCGESTGTRELHTRVLDYDTEPLHETQIALICSVRSNEKNTFTKFHNHIFREFRKALLKHCRQCIGEVLHLKDGAPEESFLTEARGAYAGLTMSDIAIEAYNDAPRLRYGVCASMEFKLWVMMDGLYAKNSLLDALLTESPQEVI